MMCVASGSALSIATFGLFPLAGLDVSPVANKPAAQSQVAILKVGGLPILLKCSSCAPNGAASIVNVTHTDATFFTGM